jgi:mono/diheme cytochrome c family protein
MIAMRRLGSSLLIFGAAALAAVSLSSPGIFAAPQTAQPKAAAPAKPAAKAAAPSQGAVDHGKYLVDNVAMCSECHTPRDEKGNLDNSHYLQGAQIWITPVVPMINWGNRAPALAGLEGFTDDQMAVVLERGIGPNGIPIQPPMHIYHMNHEDAQAIIAYLKSLPATGAVH